MKLEKEPLKPIPNSKLKNTERLEVTDNAKIVQRRQNLQAKMYKSDNIYNLYFGVGSHRRFSIERKPTLNNSSLNLSFK